MAMLVAALMAACGGGSDDKPAGLAALYGQVTIHYAFTGASSTYTEQFKLSAASLTSDKSALATTVTGDPTRGVGCVLNPATPNRPYLCVIYDAVYDTTEIFAFNLSGQTITNGQYEYCESGVSAGNCGVDLATSPDGTVTGSITATSSEQPGISSLDRSTAAALKGQEKAQASKGAPIREAALPNATAIQAAIEAAQRKAETAR